MVKKNKEISFDESGDCSAEVYEQFQKNVEAFEQEKWSQPFQVLVESGISLPPPDELADAELNAKLWEVVNALALMGAYLEHILDHVYQALPEPPYTAKEKKEVAELVYRHIWQQSASGLFGTM